MMPWSVYTHVADQLSTFMIVLLLALQKVLLIYLAEANQSLQIWTQLFIALCA